MLISRRIRFLFWLVIAPDKLVCSGMSKNLSMDGAGAPRVSKSAKQRLKSMVLGQSATDRVEGWHKVKHYILRANEYIP